MASYTAMGMVLDDFQQVYAHARGCMYTTSMIDPFHASNEKTFWQLATFVVKRGLLRRTAVCPLI